MNQPRFLVKVAAVVSSLSLAGGFIAHRAGALDWIPGWSSSPSKPAVIGDSKSKVLMEQPSATSSDSQPNFPEASQTTEIMPGSKSFTVMPSTKVLIIRSNTYTVKIGPYEPPSPETAKPPAIFFGTKSAPVIPPDPSIAPQSPAPPR